MRAAGRAGGPKRRLEKVVIRRRACHLLADAGVEVVIPPLPALLADTSGLLRLAQALVQRLGYGSPPALTQLRHQLFQSMVLRT